MKIKKGSERVNIILYHLCRHDVSLMDSWHPYPSTALSKACGLSLYKTRKELKALKANGLVESDIECLCGEEGNWILRGYHITEKAKETKEYKKAFEEEKEICKEIFDIDL